MPRLKENLDLFLEEFATTAVLDDGSSIRVIFDNEYDPMALEAEGRQIVACCKTSDTARAHHGSTLSIDKKTYTVVGIQPDMEGAFTDLILKEAAP